MGLGLNKFRLDEEIKSLAPVGGSGLPSGPAGGALNGTYPNPQLAPGAATGAVLGTDVVTTATAAGGDLSGTFPALVINAGAVTTGKLANGAATGAALGSDVAKLVGGLVPPANLGSGTADSSHILSGAGTWILPPAPSGAAGGALSGTYPNPGLANGAATGAALGSDVVVTSLANIANGYVKPNGSNLISLGQMGSGTPSASTYLRGDQTWATVPGTAFIVYGGTAGSTSAAAANVTAFNNALAALPASGGTIYVLAGLYYVNATLVINRSKVKILAEPGAFFVNTIGMCDVTMLVADWTGGTELSDVVIDGLGFDGQGYALDIANAPGALGATDSRFGGGTYSRVATGGSTTTFTVSGANWPVNRFAGMYLQISSSANGNTNLARQITSNTATTITVSSAFSGTLNGDTGWVVTQLPWAQRSSTGWGQTWGHSALMARKVKNSAFLRCKMLNYFNAGTEWNQSTGGDETRFCYFENIGASHVWDSTGQPNNPLNVLGTGTPTSRPYYMTDNIVVRNYGVCLDAHGAGADQIFVNRNFVGILPYIPNSAPWGITCEIESESINNQYVDVSNNIVYGLPYGVYLASNGNTSVFHKAINVHDNIIYSTVSQAVGVEIAGRGISITDNYIECQQPIDNNQTYGSGSTHQDILVDGNVLVGSAARPCIQLRAQAGTTWKKLRITNNKMYGDRTASDSHTGIYMSTLDGAAAITDVVVANNEFHDFYHAIWINNEAAGPITGVVLRENDYMDQVNTDFIWSAGTGIQVIGGRTQRVGASNTTALTDTARVSVVRDLMGFSDTYASSSLTIGASPWTVTGSTRDRMITVTGGTVSSITIGGTATNRTSGTFRLLGGVAMVITYSVVPTSVIAESY